MRSPARVIFAVFKREFFSYFSSPTGYVFITLFVFLSAVAAFWQERFFLNNLANLDQLNLYFPYLLVFLCPAITMTLWADERRQGTEELILTLPATGAELILGKYLAALAIYSVALIFSFSHVVVLFWLGTPDLGILFANYLGYWLMGAALLPLGLLASQLTDNLTVAFILGSLLCGVPVFLRHASSILSGRLARFAEQLSVVERFRDLAVGVVTAASVVYFLALAAAVLYLCVAVVGRRRWPSRAGSPKLGWHYVTRALCLLVAAGAATLIASRAGRRVDVTSEQIHSLSPETVKLIQGIDPRRPVSVQVYVSPEVPRSYLPVRNSITAFLQEFAAIGRERINVRITETVKYSAEAREARQRHGIVPFRVPATEESASINNEIFLGLAFSSGSEEFVIPAFDRGLPVEYELMRSIRVVSGAARRRVGILESGAKLFGGFDFQRRRQANEWSIVSELKKQYEVIQVPPDSEYPAQMDVLIAALPHTLTRPQLDRLVAHVKSGKPALILFDPMPAFNLGLAPSAAAEAANPLAQTPQPSASTDVTPLLEAIGVEWDRSRVVWDTYNPHPQLRHLPPEVVFVARENGAAQAIQDKAEITAGLQEIVLLYPGSLKARSDRDVQFVPLLTAGANSGSVRFQQLVQQTPFGTSIAQGLPHKKSGETYTLAARITRANGAPVVVMADSDVMGEEFFELRKRGVDNLNLDNVTLLLNSIDDLAGERAFIALRRRRPRLRTLEALEARTRIYEQKRDQDAEQAAVVAQRRLREAQARLDAAVASVRARQDLDDQAKQIMISNIETAENRRLQVARTNIEDERQRQLENARSSMEESVRAIQNTIKLLAVALPPIPAFVLFVLMSIRKVARERSRISTDRLLSKTAQEAAQ